MRRGLVYALLLAAALLIPSEGVELGKMIPVETLYIQYKEGQIILQTDTEDVGTGATAQEAMADLEQTTAGRIFPDTTVFLLVDENAKYYIEAIEPYLKGNVRLCELNGDADLKAVGEYLHAHHPKMKLKQWRKGMQLQALETENGRMKIK